MTIRIGLLSTLLVGILLAGVSALCPTSCGCTPETASTYRCLQCLQTYFRKYSMQQQDCICMTDFVDQRPPRDTCCPSNCSYCTDTGCVSCRKHWQLQTNVALGFVVCICQLNYYYNGVDCVCKSEEFPTLYYRNSRLGLCLPCPHNCTCNSSGCVQCDDPLRVLYQDQLGQTTCTCIKPYVERDGSCQPPKGCDFDWDGSVICGSQTHRTRQNGVWYCNEGYPEKDGWCTCQLPKVQVEKYLSKFCVCGSKTDWSKYYEIGGVCLACPSDCICNERGCVSCSSSTNRVAYGGKCDCVHPYTEVLGSCICVEPYWTSLSLGTCICMSRYNENLYSYNPISDTCYKCPKGCQCQFEGCVSCSVESLRKIITFDAGWYLASHCDACADYAELIDGQCRCVQYATFLNGICSCDNSSAVYTDSMTYSSPRCMICPPQCNCSADLGCYQCQSSYFRTIITDLSNYSTCPCQGIFSEQDGSCVCQFVFDDATSSCMCPDNYYFENGKCECSSKIDPSAFYEDKVNGGCYPCPIGCLCDETGCRNCSTNSLRFSYNSSGKWECPCIQKATFRDGKCTYCDQFSFYSNGGCVPCPSCQYCDFRGCISCNSGTYLIGFQCVCDNQTLINIGGHCRCPPSLYDDHGFCQLCPANCYQCYLAEHSIVCLSCPKHSHRQDSPEDGCPCQPSYKQMPSIQSYCCHKTCHLCTQMGCISCSPFSQRYLQEQTWTCACINNLIELPNNTACGCRDGQYLYLDHCIACPKNCLTCEYSQLWSVVLCRSCPANSNRNISISTTCQCLPNFMQANPVRSYCYPKKCVREELICTECQAGRILTSNGTECRCQIGFFENQVGDCQRCGMEGCLDCLWYNYCVLCNTVAEYYLTGSTCKLNLNTASYVYSQNQQDITLQLKLSDNVTFYNTILSLESYVERISEKLDKMAVVSPPIYLPVLEKSLSEGNILNLRLGHPTVEMTNSMLAVSYVLARRQRVLLQFNGTDSQGPYQASGEVLYIKLELVRSQATAVPSLGWPTDLEHALVALLMVAFLILFLRGFKHNQGMFFLQTLGLLSFVVTDSNHEMVTQMYELRIAYFGFGGAMRELIPNHYLQQSVGNFQQFTLDSNIIRVAGTTIIVAAVVGSVSLLLRVVHSLLKLCSSHAKLVRVDNFIAFTKKPIYRCLEFAYQACMYPLLFFSILTLLHWQPSSLSEAIDFKNKCNLLAALIISAYFISVLWQVVFETVAIIHKLQRALNFCSALSVSLILTLSMSTKWYLLLVLIFVVRAAVYIVLRRKYIRGFHWGEYIKLIIACFESTTVCVLLAGSVAAFIVLTLATILLLVTHEAIVVVWTDTSSTFGKQFSTENPEESSCSKLDQANSVIDI